MRNFRITFLIVGCLFVFGIYALARIPKQEFPEYTIRSKSSWRSRSNSS